MVEAKKACIASVCNVTDTKTKESNSVLNAEDASSLVMEGKGEEKLQEESKPKAKEEKEASDDAEEEKDKNKENEKEEVEEARKKENIEVDGKNEEKKVNEGRREVDAKEPNKGKEMEMVKESREETKNDGGKKKKMTKKTIRLIKKEKIAAKNDKGIVGVEVGEVKKTVKGDEEASDDAEEGKDKNKENEKEEVEEVRKKENIEVDGKNEEKKVNEGRREVDAKEPNKGKEMEMVKESREETKNDGGKKRKMAKKTIRLIKKEKIAAKNDDKGIVGVEDGEVKKIVKGDEKKEEISVDEQKIEMNADEAKKEVKPCKENKEVKINEKEKQKLEKSGKRKRENKVDDSLVSQETKSLKNKEKAATENVEMIAGDAGKTSNSGIKESAGLIFMCNRNTKRDCFKYKVLGLPANKKELVAKVYKGMRLFLFDVDHRLMYGIYRAAGPGGYNIEPKAFNSAFPSQVRFKVVSECTPLPEKKFKAAIRDNYFKGKRFSSELTVEQVKKLCKLFTSSRNDDLARKDTGSLDIDKRQWRRVRGWKHREGVRDRWPATSSRSHGVQMGTSSRFTELPREAEPVSRVRGLVREREPIRAHRLSRDSTLISGVHGLSRESFPMAGDDVLPRERLLVDGVHRRETGIYDREASDIYTREFYALPPPPPPLYVREGSLHADLRHRELELERRERRLLELEQRQQKMIQYEEPYQYKDPTVYHDRWLPHETDYTSRRRY